MSEQTGHAMGDEPSWQERLGLAGVAVAALVVAGLYLAAYTLVTTPGDDLLVERPDIETHFSLLATGRYLRYVVGVVFVAVLAYETRPRPLGRGVEHAIVATLAAAILTWHIRTEPPEALAGGLYVICMVTAVLSARVAWPVALVTTPLAALAFAAVPRPGETGPRGLGLAAMGFVQSADDRTTILYGVALGAAATLAGGVGWWIGRRARAGLPRPLEGAKS